MRLSEYWLDWLKTIVPFSTVVGAPSELAWPRSAIDVKKLLQTPLQPRNVVVPVYVLASLLIVTPLVATETLPFPVMSAEPDRPPSTLNVPPSPIVTVRAVST